MALNDLTVGQMIRVTKGLLNPKGARPLLASLKRVQPWMDDLEEVYTALLETQLASSKNPLLAEIMAKQATADRTHDRRLSGTHDLLTALATLAPELGLDAQALTATRDQLFPDGAAMVNRGYADEAAQVDLLPKRLTDASKALLANVTINDKPLDELKNAWISSARELGKLEDERETVVASDGATPKATAAQARAARNSWINTVGTVRKAIVAHKELTPAQLEKLLGRLNRYEAGVTKDDDDEDEEGGGGGGGGGPPPG